MKTHAIKYEILGKENYEGKDKSAECRKEKEDNINRDLEGQISVSASAAVSIMADRIPLCAHGRHRDGVQGL